MFQTKNADVESDDNHLVSIVRIRPLKSNEQPITPDLSVGPDEIVAHVNNVPKSFTFNRVFGMEDSQKKIYEAGVRSILHDVLIGYNCTIFAYGQTSSGKTHTMVGKLDNGNFSFNDDSNAGIIPRALNELLHRLKESETEGSITVSFLEIYNETLTDLLATKKLPLKLYEDPKSKGRVQVLNLIEVPIKTAEDALEIIRMGTQRKNMASTLLNAQSSRSHTIFTINVRMKEKSEFGEFINVGKLQLVDLAGSENVKRSGVVQSTARETFNINQSLLTLGLVIKALLKKSTFIPYRQSKLTRILQDSLGGNSKTVFIATISPDQKNFFESMNTLEYACRAQAILCNPQKNKLVEIVTKVKLYKKKIDFLESKISEAQTEKGVYMASHNYDQFKQDDEETKKKLLESVAQCAELEAQVLLLENKIQELQSFKNVKDEEIVQMLSILRSFKKKLKQLFLKRRIGNELLNKYYEAQTLWIEHTNTLSEELDTYIGRHNTLRAKVDDLYNVANANKISHEIQRQEQVKINERFMKSLQDLDMDFMDAINKRIKNCNEDGAEMTKVIDLWKEEFDAAKTDMEGKVKELSQQFNYTKVSYLNAFGINQRVFEIELNRLLKQLQEEKISLLEEIFLPLNENIESSETIFEDFGNKLEKITNEMIKSHQEIAKNAALKMNCFESLSVTKSVNQLDSLIKEDDSLMHHSEAKVQKSFSEMLNRQLTAYQHLQKEKQKYREKQEATIGTILEFIHSLSDQMKKCEHVSSQKRHQFEKFQQSLEDLKSGLSTHIDGIGKKLKVNQVEAHEENEEIKRNVQRAFKEDDEKISAEFEAMKMEIINDLSKYKETPYPLEPVEHIKKEIKKMLGDFNVEIDKQKETVARFVEEEKRKIQKRLEVTEAFLNKLPSF